MDIAWIIGRAQRLLLSPATEWDAIAGEAGDVQKTYMNYVGPLVIVSAIAAALGIVSLLGFGFAIKLLVTQIVMGLVMVYVLAIVINALAPTFGATPDMGQAFKLAAYSPTASWVAGLLMIVPILGVLALVGALYSLYLLYVGLPKLMKPPEDKAMTYTLSVIGTMIVIGIVMAFVSSAI
ncbi:MAG: Yip1 family protein [Micropepsaceae bacterium]